MYSLRSGLNYGKFIGHNLAQPSLTTPLARAVCILIQRRSAMSLPVNLHSQSRNHLSNFIANESTTGVAPTFEIPPLPATVSLKKIYADLLGYLFDHSTLAPTIGFLMLTLAEARDFFQNNTVDGATIWNRLGQQLTICLATPNGWETSQQVRLSRPSMTIIYTDNAT